MIYLLQVLGRLRAAGFNCTKLAILSLYLIDLCSDLILKFPHSGFELEYLGDFLCNISLLFLNILAYALGQVLLHPKLVLQALHLIFQLLIGLLDRMHLSKCLHFLLSHDLDLCLSVLQKFIILVDLVLDFLELALPSLQLGFDLISVSLSLSALTYESTFTLSEIELLLFILINCLLLQDSILLF